MQISTLNKKLSKSNVSTEVIDHNDFNKSLIFTLNGKQYEASFNSDEMKVNSYCIEFGYDEANQESRTRFFDTFTQVLNHSQD